MNIDILKGKLLEIKGRVKETWGKLTDNDLRETEGKGEILLGLLQKKYGHIRDNAQLDYNDGVELAEIVSRIRQTMTNKNDIMAIAFIARYGKLLLANSQESQMTEKEKRHGSIAIVILMPILIGALPTWPHSKSWGYTDSGTIPSPTAPWTFQALQQSAATLSVSTTVIHSPSLTRSRLPVRGFDPFPRGLHRCFA